MFVVILYLKGYNQFVYLLYLYPKGYKCKFIGMSDKGDMLIADFVREMRKKFNLTQVDLADKSGVGLRFVRELEQGKQTLRLDKVNQVLKLFGRQVGAVELSQTSSHAASEI